MAVAQLTSQSFAIAEASSLNLIIGNFETTKQIKIKAQNRHSLQNFSASVWIRFAH